MHRFALEVAPVLPLDDGNFLLLAEFAHVVRDTLALRGIQVQDFCSTGLDHVFQGAARADKSIGMDGSFDKANVWNEQRISSILVFQITFNLYLIINCKVQECSCFLFHSR